MVKIALSATDDGILEKTDPAENILVLKVGEGSRGFGLTPEASNLPEALEFFEQLKEIKACSIKGFEMVKKEREEKQQKEEKDFLENISPNLFLSNLVDGGQTGRIVFEFRFLFQNGKTGEARVKIHGEGKTLQVEEILGPGKWIEKYTKGKSFKITPELENFHPATLRFSLLKELERQRKIVVLKKHTEELHKKATISPKELREGKKGFAIADINWAEWDGKFKVVKRKVVLFEGDGESNIRVADATKPSSETVENWMEWMPVSKLSPTLLAFLNLAQGAYNRRERDAKKGIKIDGTENASKTEAASVNKEEPPTEAKKTKKKGGKQEVEKLTTT